MNKRQFIDTVRQFRVLAIRKNKSYAESVRACEELYLKQAAEDGASEPEMEKNRAWAAGFTQREYFHFDARAGDPATG